jgi:hypothetical protein
VSDPNPSLEPFNQLFLPSCNIDVSTRRNDGDVNRLRLANTAVELVPCVVQGPIRGVEIDSEPTISKIMLAPLYCGYDSLDGVT